MENKIFIQILIHKTLEGGYFEDRADKIPAYERKDTMEDTLEILWSAILTVSVYSWPLH